VDLFIYLIETNALPLHQTANRLAVNKCTVMLCLKNSTNLQFWHNIVPSPVAKITTRQV